MCRDEEYSVSGITNRAQELCESRDGHPRLPVHNSLYGLCGRKATLNSAEPILAEFGGKCVETKCGAWHWVYMSDCCVAGVDVNTQFSGGWSGLMYAGNGARGDILKLLLERGADPNYQKGTG